ncbi:MAG: alpha/beta fold hydrolase [Thermodesulfovibrionales bacterium]
MTGPDFEIFEGCREKPAIVFIHGLGMDKRIWVSPHEARILAGQFPIHILLCKKRPALRQKAQDEQRGSKSPLRQIVIGTPECKLQTVFHDLRKEGYTLIAYSQKRPASPLDIAILELKVVLESTINHSPSGFILIGHSRGGLIGRRYLHHYKDNRIKALITISTPHKGTRMATLVKYISPFASFIKPLIPESERGTILYLFKRISEFLSAPAVKELLPDSDIIKSLDDNVVDGVKYLSIGGSSPSLLCFNRITEVNEGKGEKFKMEKILSFPDAVERLIPRRFLPREIRKGEGDGLVSVESSRMPEAEHYTFSLNHAEILFSKRVRERLVHKIKEFTG